MSAIILIHDEPEITPFRGGVRLVFTSGDARYDFELTRFVARCTEHGLRALDKKPHRCCEVLQLGEQDG